LNLLALQDVAQLFAIQPGAGRALAGELGQARAVRQTPRKMTSMMRSKVIWFIFITVAGGSHVHHLRQALVDRTPFSCRYIGVCCDRCRRPQYAVYAKFNEIVQVNFGRNGRHLIVAKRVLRNQKHNQRCHDHLGQIWIRLSKFTALDTTTKHASDYFIGAQNYLIMVKLCKIGKIVSLCQQ